MPGNTINPLQAGSVSSQSISKQELLRRSLGTASFEAVLQQELKTPQPLTFSKHAQERVSQRGIELSTELMTGLRDAVEKARGKGVQNMVVIEASSAFIVNVPSSTVVTTMSGHEMKDNIFTNIDSAVII